MLTIEKFLFEKNQPSYYLTLLMFNILPLDTGDTTVNLLGDGIIQSWPISIRNSPYHLDIEYDTPYQIEIDVNTKEIINYIFYYDINGII